MTNCNYVRHAVKQNEKDLSICLKSFENITKDQWLSMCDVHNYKLENNNIEKHQIIINSDKFIPNDSTEDNPILSEILTDSKEEIRKKRLLFYQQKK
jgi:hypothetical protein